MNQKSGFFSTEDVAKRLGVSGATVRGYAKTYGHVLGRELGHDGNQGWVFRTGEVDAIEQASKRIGDFGSFEKALRAVLTERVTVPSEPGLVLVGSSDEAREIREAVLDFELRLLETLEPLLDRAEMLVAGRDLGNRILLQTLENRVGSTKQALQELRSGREQQAELIRNLLHYLSKQSEFIQKPIGWPLHARVLVILMSVCLVMLSVLVVRSFGIVPFGVGRPIAKHSIPLAPSAPRAPRR